MAGSTSERRSEPDPVYAMGSMAWGVGGGKLDPSAEVVRRGDAIEGRPVMRRVFFRPGSMGVDAGTRREVEERIRRAPALEMAPGAERRPAGRLAAVADTIGCVGATGGGDLRPPLTD